MPLGALSGALWHTDHMTGACVPLPFFPAGNATTDGEGETDTTTREFKHRPQDAGTNKPAAGLVQVSVLEGGDGADAGRPPVLGKNNICKRDRCKSSAANLASLLVFC